MIIPRVYVGTYGKYNRGSIYGRWMEPGEYDTYEEFMEACSELHGDEPEGCRELMFQDCEDLPEKLYSESYFSEAAFEYCKALNKVFLSEQEALQAYAELFTINEGEDADDIIDDFHEKYYGYYDSDEDAFYEQAEEELDMFNVPVHLRNCFDYEEYARQMMEDFREQDGYYFWAY